VATITIIIAVVVVVVVRSVIECKAVEFGYYGIHAGIRHTILVVLIHDNIIIIVVLQLAIGDTTGM
jgi:hypothetical protein